MTITLSRVKGIRLDEIKPLEPVNIGGGTLQGGFKRTVTIHTENETHTLVLFGNTFIDLASVVLSSEDPRKDFRVPS
jgi:hypothetical protein